MCSKTLIAFTDTLILDLETKHQGNTYKGFVKINKYSYVGQEDLSSRNDKIDLSHDSST